MQVHDQQLNQPISVSDLLRIAGLTRAELAKAFGVTPQRISQIFGGHGVSYLLADDLQRYINAKAGRTVCRNEHFISHPRKETPRRR